VDEQEAQPVNEPEDKLLHNRTDDIVDFPYAKPVDKQEAKVVDKIV
jgi:hypothetical protein